MTKLYRVTMVDVNNVIFYVPVEAYLPEVAAANAEFENKYMSVVEVSERNEAGEWVPVYYPDDEEEWDDDYDDDSMTDVEADADTLRNIGWGTDEEYFHEHVDYEA